MQNSSSGPISASEERHPSDADIQSVKEAIRLLAKAFKNYVMYPPDHGITAASVKELGDVLNELLMNIDVLRLDIVHNKIFYQGIAVWEEEGGESFPYVLNRDGVQWIAFKKGITRDEMTAFFGIVHRYRFVEDEAEADIVTSLWEADFDHVAYHAADISWEVEPSLDFLEKDLRMPPGDDPAEESPDHPGPKGPSSPLSIGMDRRLWRLTPEEEAAIREMVREEEEWDTVGDELDVLLLILDDQKEPGHFKAVLEFLAEEFREALGRREFVAASKMMSGIESFRKGSPDSRPWAADLIDAFIKTVSSKDVLAVLETLHPIDHGDFQPLRHVLTRLAPEAVFSIAPLMAKPNTPEVQKGWMDVIGVLTERDIRPLEVLLDGAAPPLVEHLVRVLCLLKNEDSRRVLVKMLGHSSEAVRVLALESVLARRLVSDHDLFQWVDDPSDAVVRLILRYFERERSADLEHRFIEYLSRPAQAHASSRRLDCFRTLGRVGSDDAVPFLREVLLGRSWRCLIGMDRPEARFGAALALKGLNTETSRELLEKASRHLAPSIREACEKARRDYR